MWLAGSPGSSSQYLASRKRACESEKSDEFEDESKNEEPGVAGEVRFRDEEAPEDDQECRVENITDISQSAITQTEVR